MDLSTKNILAALEKVELLGPQQSLSFRGVCTDTRGDCRGALFVALTGERFDGNAFLHAAQKAGALGAIIGPASAGSPLPDSLQCFRVPDTLKALQSLAACKRNLNRGCRAVALTGSNGKSTTKEMVASILGRKFRVHATTGNFNNHIGVPLTVLGMSDKTEILVAEIGANHPGEVRTLARLVKPEISVITNVAPAHLEGFGSLEGVCNAKLELFEETLEAGCCIYHGDNPLLRAKAQKAFPRRTLSFGLGADNDLVATQIVLDNKARASFSIGGKTRLHLGIPGRHNVLNSLAAIAVGKALGLAERDIIAGLEASRPLKMRMELRTIGRLLVLNDAYNANPLSMREALTTLETIEHKGPRAAVIGEMLELGPEAEKLHTDLARFLAERRLALVVLVGRFAQKMKEAYISAGGNEQGVFPCQDAASAWKILKEKLSGEELLLVKGSRGIHLELIVEELEKAGA
ncbi:MAG TPA: UDP-N-acetylmuramoyl-tripeptide--D-alanyl-D-alanine ligase [archaeon]|nr:UDP-N-acetylmuramoyl-tripeptide--D-alanyl-D-alanine ligase [archaeon]